MLTKDDLKALKKIVREEIEAEGENIKDLVQSEVKLAGIRVASELQEVNTRLKNLEIKISRIEKDVKKLRKDLTATIDFFDKRNLKIQHQLRETRSNLKLPQLEFA